MVGRLTERFHRNLRESKTTVIHNTTSLPLPYSPQQINKNPQQIQDFLQRNDVMQAFPYLSPRRKVSLTTVGVAATNGDTHEYFVLKQGRKRFLFDTEESPLPEGTSDEQRQKGLSFTLVVPQQIMHEKGLMPEDQHALRVFQSRSDIRRFFRTIEKEGYFAMRGITDNPRSLENNTDFIQPVPAVVVKDANNNILFTVREGNTNHDERLSGKISIPFSMGHSEPSDFGLWRKFARHGLKHAMYREAAEETALKNRQETFHVFPTRNGHDYAVTLGGIMRLRHYYNIQPLGVVHGEDSPVDKVHAGVIFVATPRRKNVAFTLNGSSREVTQIVPLSARAYNDAVEQQTVTPASWNEPIVREIYSPRKNSRRRQ